MTDDAVLKNDDMQDKETHISSESTENELEKLHLSSIRTKLKEAKETYQNNHSRKMSRTTLYNYLRNEGVNISPSTVEDLYNPDSDRTRINLSAILKLCELFGADASEVLALPGETSIPTSNGVKKTDKTRKQFFDLHYSGVFHVYFLRFSGTDSSYKKAFPHSLKKTEDLIHGTLEFVFNEDNKTSKCHFKYTQDYTSAYNTPKSKTVFATCVPYESVFGRNLFLDFVDDEGSFFWICCDHQEFKTSDCYFRIAIMVTENTGVGHYPVCQKLVMFRNEPPKESFEYIRGLLNFATKDIVIEREELSSLCNTDPEISAFVDNYGNILSNTPYLKNDMVVINEDMILNTQSAISPAKIMRALSKLRHHGYMQNQLFVGVDPHAHELVRDLESTAKGQNETY